MKEGSKAVVIMGSARSGTSMTAGLIARLGVHIATNEPKPFQLKFNPTGMYEHVDFTLLSDIQKEIRGDFTKENLQEIREKYREQLENLFEKHSGDHSIWGFKNTAIESANIYLPILKNPHIVFVTRSPAEHARAYQAFVCKENPGKDFPLIKSLIDVIDANRRNAHMIAKNSQYPRYFTTYESIRADSLGEALNIAEFLKVAMTPEMGKQITNYIDPSLRSWRNKNLNEAVYKHPLDEVQ